MKARRQEHPQRHPSRGRLRPVSRSFAAATLALPATCRGAFYALKTDGSVQVFAGTSLGLYRLDNTTLGWVPVSRVTTVTISAASPGVITRPRTAPLSTTPRCSPTPAVRCRQRLRPARLLLRQNRSDREHLHDLRNGRRHGDQHCGDRDGHAFRNLALFGAIIERQWQFAQTGNLVFATQANDVLQVYDLSSATAFSNALGSPPQAAYISVVGRFLVLSGLLSLPYRIQWSGLNSFNASTSWDGLTAGSDHQDFPDGGIVRGVAGGEFGTVFQDQAIRRMSYIPGSALIFQIERITQDMGLYAPYSIIRAGSTIYFRAGQGFYKIDPGSVPVQIGRERVDRTFLRDLDSTSLQLFQGAADPRGTLIYWAYKSGAGATGLYDKILGYDTALDRFFPLSVSGEYLLGVSQAGLTLENLDTISSSLDALDADASMHTPRRSSRKSLSSTAPHKQGFFTGANLEATLQSSEQGTDGHLVYIRGFRPITDATTFTALFLRA
jgi:hypothetical protein